MKNSKETESAVCDSCCVSNMNVSVCFEVYALSHALILVRFVSSLAIWSASKTRLYLITLSNIRAYYPMYPLASICCLLCCILRLDPREIKISSYAGE
jgi:hypothetical protein